MTRADTIARHVNAYTDALGVVVSNTVGYMAAANNEERGHIQRDLHAAMEQSRQHLHLAFLECLGGAAVAGEAATPEPPKPAGWVLQDTADVRYCWRGNGVRGGGGNWRPLVAEVVPFAAESEAREAAKRLAHIDTRVLPVDAAGNVIEEPATAPAPREPDGWVVVDSDGDAQTAYLSVEVDGAKRAKDCAAECDSTVRPFWFDAVPGPGVAWEAARAGEEAERLRAELAAVKAERDALAAEVQRSREQKPVRWAVMNRDGDIAGIWFEPDARSIAASHEGWRVAPLYLAPVVRDHSGVIAQCEGALREWDSKGAHCSATSSLVAITLTKARNALRGAS